MLLPPKQHLYSKIRTPEEKLRGAYFFISISALLIPNGVAQSHPVAGVDVHHLGPVEFLGLIGIDGKERRLLAGYGFAEDQPRIVQKVYPIGMLRILDAPVVILHVQDETAAINAPT